MHLFIDTSKHDTVKITLDKNGETFVEERKTKNHRNQLVLSVIENILKKHNLKITDITSVQAHPGPGSFTGIRVGIAIAHAMRYALHIQEMSIEQVY